MKRLAVWSSTLLMLAAHGTAQDRSATPPGLLQAEAGLLDESLARPLLLTRRR